MQQRLPAAVVAVASVDLDGAVDLADEPGSRTAKNYNIKATREAKIGVALPARVYRTLCTQAS